MYIYIIIYIYTSVYVNIYIYMYTICILYVFHIYMRFPEIWASKLQHFKGKMMILGDIHKHFLKESCYQLSCVVTLLQGRYHDSFAETIIDTQSHLISIFWQNRQTCSTN